MSTGLIGHTGFVGSNLLQQRSYDFCFHSRNIEEIRGKKFTTLVCSGAPAAKWIANQQPAEDKENLLKLQSALSVVEADFFVLISTVDVFPSPIDVDENSPASAPDHHAYGKHRYELEQFVKEKFPHHLIIRLPGLFGTGLKKNVIFDLLHNNMMEKIDPAAAYQYYHLRRLTADIDLARKADLSLAHFATEPVATGTIVERFFPGAKVAAPSEKPGRYDFKTLHASVYGKSGGYMQDQDEVLAELASFISAEKGRS